MPAEKSPQFTQPPHMEALEVPIGTVGRSMAQMDEFAVREEFMASVEQDRIDYAARLSNEKVHPNAGKLRYIAARVVAKAMTREEAGLVNRVNDPTHDYLDYHKNTAETGRKARENTLKAMRSRFSLVKGDRADDLDDYLDQVAPAFLQDQRSGKSQPDGEWSDSKIPTWASWLTKRASDEQLVNFAQWNVAYNAEQQKRPDIVSHIQREREHFRQAIPEAVEAGWLSRSSLDSLAQIDDVSVALMDPVESIVRRVSGERSLDKVLIKAHGMQSEELAEQMHGVLPHEFNHALIQTVHDEEDLGQRWIMEALTELSTRVIRHSKEQNAYVAEQGLYMELMDDGAVALSWKLGTRAYSGGESEKQAFHTALDESWGVTNTLAKVTEYIYKQEAELRTAGKFKTEVQLGAISITRFVLRHRPQLIFGENYQHPSGSEPLQGALQA
jgi:hypothetical protein